MNMSEHAGSGQGPSLAPGFKPRPLPPPAQGGNDSTFRTLQKCIKNEGEVALFKRSDTFAELTGFILGCNQAVKGVSCVPPPSCSPFASALAALLAELQGMVKDHPPVQQPMRYGNVAFRSWFDGVNACAEEKLRAALPSAAASDDNVRELAAYLCSSFGDRQRIDYGTGHELNFVALLLCLSKLQAFPASDAAAIVLVVFTSYISLCRCLQRTYFLEPAGSHGVWSLDDYQFLPFLWGSAQLIESPDVRPASISSPDIVARAAPAYMYMAAVQFACVVKTGPLHEHSPMLNDISQVASWAKLNVGMIKMFEAEVLLKFPVIQHFLFGKLLPPPQQMAK